MENNLPDKCNLCDMYKILKNRVTGNCMNCSILDSDDYDKYIDAQLKEEMEGEWIIR